MAGKNVIGNVLPNEVEKPLELDINKYVTVILTDYWKQKLKEHFMELCKNNNYKSRGRSSLEEYVEKDVMSQGNNGYYQFELWYLMQIFWKYLSQWNGNALFKEHKIIFSESDKLSYWAKRVSDKLSKSLLKALGEKV